MPTPWHESLPLQPIAPRKADVVVVGAGLAGLSAAAALRQAGTNVVVVDAAPALGEGVSGRCLGLVRLGLVEHPARLAAALGRDDALEILRFTLQNRELLLAQDLLEPTGGLCLARDAAEAEVIAKSQRLLEQAGASLETWDGEVLGAHGLQGPTMGHFVYEEGLIDPMAALAHYALGLEIAGQSRVEAVRDAGTRLEVVTPGGAFTAEMVLLTPGTGLPSIEGWFHDKVSPVRHQARAVVCEGPGMGWSLSNRHLQGRPWDDLHVLQGARWATPHMEESETHPGVQPEVHAALGRLAEQHLRPTSLEGPAWSFIAAHSCDQLPFVGAVPGRSRVLVAGAFGGEDASLAVAAGHALASIVLTGQASIPARLRPDRMA